jgi:phosphatidylserine/phosphatidylglycerophosphate/cardiolipin synthase-like enzyme
MGADTSLSVRHAVAARGAASSGRLPDADVVEWLVDNARTYDALVAAIGRAEHSVWITQLALDADCVAYATGARGGDVVLIQELLDAAARGVDVRVLLNASLLLDTARPLSAFLKERNTGIRLRGVSKFPQLLHAKMLIADERHAFLVGSPFVNGYWDDSRHRPIDARRPVRELGGRPLHDVSFRVGGTAVAGLCACFADLWNEVAGGDVDNDSVSVPATVSDAASSGTSAFSVVRTVARNMLAEHPDGVDEILAALLDGIAGAHQTIYIEHQYLSARPIIAALAAALERAPELEVVVLLNQNPDITAYRGWQNKRLAEAGLLDHPRVGLFALWSVERGQGSCAINQVFVHSKVLTVDDAWATVGSANLDGVSLHSYGDDFSGRIARRVFRHVRNFDVNVVVNARGDGQSGVVQDLRERLWREHLGESVDSHVGGLRRWREQAARNVESLNRRAATDIAPCTTLILPYSLRSTPARQLRNVGIRLDGTGMHLQFNPGWLEVHASPNWVRNMFL